MMAVVLEDIFPRLLGRCQASLANLELDPQPNAALGAVAARDRKADIRNAGFDTSSLELNLMERTHGCVVNAEERTELGEQDTLRLASPVEDGPLQGVLRLLPPYARARTFPRCSRCARAAIPW